MQILQIGCNNGKDHVLEFVKQNFLSITKLILVDASFDAIELCKKTYKDFLFCDFLMSAVTHFETDFIEIHMPTGHESSEHISVNKNHLVRHHHKNIKTSTVPAISINNLFEKYNLNNLDRLYIDTEGLDVQLIQALDFNKFKIKYIQYEHAHSEGPFITNGINYNLCINKLLNYNYKIKSNGTDTIAFTE